MQSRSYKVTILIFTLSCILGSLGTIFTSRMYPILPVSMALGAFSVYLLIEIIDDFRWPYLLCFVGFSTFYRCFTFLYPASLTGADADSYAFTIARVLINHSTSAIQFGFYKKAPLYIIFGANISQITGLGLRYALTGISIILGTIIPITAYVVGRRLSPRTGHLAALLTVVAPSSVLLSFNPVAQSLSAAMLMALFIIFLIYMDGKWVIPLLPLLVLLLAIYHTHKLAPQMLALAIVAGLFLAVFNSTRVLSEKETDRGNSYIILALIFVVGIYLHWIITGIGSSIISQFLTALAGGPTATTSTVNLAAAEPTISNPLITIIGNVGYRIPLSLLSGLGWVLLWYQYGNQPWVQVLLGLVGSYMLLAIGAQFGIAKQTPTRFFLAIVPFLAILSAHVVDQLLSSSIITAPRVKIVFALLLIVAIIGTQSVSLLGPRDSTVSQRAYLTENELAGKIWGYEYIPGPIYTDQFYANELPPSKLMKFAQQNETPPTQYRDSSIDILNGNIKNMSCYGMVRTNVERYSFQGRMELTYNPENRLSTSNVIYSNSNVATSFTTRKSCHS